VLWFDVLGTEHGVVGLDSSGFGSMTLVRSLGSRVVNLAVLGR
jgi:hypothetical protein